MKKRPGLALLLALSTLNSPLSTLHAQGTVFTYQGRLNDGGAPANGTNYGMVFYLYDAPTNGNQLGNLGIVSVTVSNGLFTVPLNFNNVFDGNPRWLEISVQKNGGAFSTLIPRQALTPTPYAIFAEGANAAGLSGTISSTNLGGSYSNAVSFNNGTNSFSGTFTGSGSGLIDVWHTGGNLGTTPGANYLGTADNEPLILKVNNQQVFRFESTTDAPNVIGGWGNNSVQSGLTGVTIGGGGSAYGVSPNFVTGGGNFAVISGGAGNFVTGSYGAVGGGLNNGALGSYSTVGGGYVNTAGADRSTVGGGYENYLDPSDVASTIAGGHFHRMDGNVTSSAIGGGYNNIMETNAYRATIAGGNANIIHAGAYQSSIGGGAYNAIGTNAASSTIAGGANNSIYAGATQSAIGGGQYNAIGTNSTASVIAGGYVNTMGNNVTAAVIAGGFQNVMGDNSYQAMIAGGYANDVQPGAPYSAISGGFQNVIGTNAPNSVVGGGYQNSVQPSSPSGTIGGGSENVIRSFSSAQTIGGGYGNIIQGNYYYYSSNYLVCSTIAGGLYNTIATNNYADTIGGGQFNAIGTNTSYAAIGGGYVNRVGSNITAAVIAGGYANSVGDNASEAAIAGGYYNTIQSNAYDANIAGGINNLIGTNSYKATIGGGAVNSIGNNADSAVIAGGLGNTIGIGSGGSFIGGGVQSTIGTNSKVSTIAGGNLNYIADNIWQAAIGGGLFNTNAGFAATIPGGYLNLASGTYSFAAGQRAKAIYDGAFVWADSQNADFSSTSTNQFDVRANGGVNFVTSGAGMTLDGQPVLSSASSVNAATLGGLASSSFWQLGGNTVSSGQFLGSVNNQPVVIQANNQPVMQLAYASNSASGYSPNVIGGNGANYVAAGVVGAAIGGGGMPPGFIFGPNVVSADFGTVVGGSTCAAQGRYSIAGGSKSVASGQYAVAFGASQAKVDYAVAMGNSTASGTNSTAFGASQATNSYATAMGHSTADGTYSTALGSSSAEGAYSFAAGHYSDAATDNSFVWSDGNTFDNNFSSTAPNQFLIHADGGVGIGLTNPAAALHVSSGGNYTFPQVLLTQQNSSDSCRLRLNVSGYNFWEMDVASGSSPQLQFWYGGTANPRMTVDTSGNLFVTGMYTSSDRNLKENFSAVSPQEVLDKVAALPITRWNFKQDKASEHLGPMAQDFRAAFDLGTDDKHIATVDEGGVALAAIQGLNQKMEAQQTELNQKETEITELKRKNDSLEERLGALEKIILNQKPN